MYTITSATANTFTFVDAVTVTAISASTACLLGGGGYGPDFQIVGCFEDATQAAAAITALKAGTLPGQGIVMNYENGLFGTIDITWDY